MKHDKDERRIASENDFSYFNYYCHTICFGLLFRYLQSRSKYINESERFNI